MGVDSFSWETVEIENDALKSSLSLGIRDRVSVALVQTGNFYSIRSQFRYQNGNYTPLLRNTAETASKLDRSSNSIENSIIVARRKRDYQDDVKEMF